MGFKSVYKCLVDVFPQVDPRLLKAVAIEHSKDADTAVEIVLLEVLPFMDRKFTAPTSPPEDHRRSGLSDGAEPKEQTNPLPNEEVSLENAVASSSELSSSTSGDANKADLRSGVRHADSTCQKEFNLPTVSLSDTHVDFNLLQGNIEREKLILLEEHQCQEDSFWSGFIHTSNSVSNSVMHEDNVGCSEAYDNVDHTQVCSGTESDVPASLGKFQGINVHIGHEASLSTNALQDNGCSSGCVIDNSEEKDFDGNSQQEGVFLNGTAFGVDNSVIEETVDAAGGLHPIVSSTTSNDCHNEQSKQSNKIDLLEEMVEDAKLNKKALFTAMESIIKMMRLVELQEKAVELAREEAATGGLDILVKVEELKQILHHAKEANDMHAGEVYGERAILATEVKELEARLHSLSDERDKALAILDEMHQTLQTRLAAAEDLRKAAEQENLEKEESARNALAEQEAIMEKVVQESKLLQQEARENSKLRDFLVDRGQVVDALQGEISVICQDVRLLKEKFDERVPLSESISSSQTSCILASSGSSHKSRVADVASGLGETLKSPKETSPTSSLHSQSPMSRSEEEKDIRSRNGLLDDDWEVFE